MPVTQQCTQLTAELRDFDLFRDVKDETLQWLVENSECRTFAEGEKLFSAGDRVDHMQIILTGGYVVRMENNGRKRELGMWKAPYVAGLLPYSRMVDTQANGYCSGETKVLMLHRDRFQEMIALSYPLTEALVGVMTNRVRDFQQMRLMDEKLMALGKMSAGLAHELNNPAAAIVRSSQELNKHLQQTPERFKSVITMKVTPASTDKINEVLFERLGANVDTEDLTLMQREERYDDLTDWFEEHDMTEGDDVIDTFIDFDFRPEHLEKVAAAIPAEALEPVLWWIESSLTSQNLIDDIQTASERIADLVKSIKSYSHMDQEPSLEFINVNDGIKSTVTMLYHRIKKQNIGLCKTLDAELPYVKALGGELNQVWTNLISNALDALPDKGGELSIRSFRETDCVCVEVEDNGPGIPAEIQSRVFEPFYTTKGIGEGTGMGLDIVRRVIDHHNGSVHLESQPGRTVFRVCFPA